jgi:imidazolonepropionase-like amidohydrolase
MATFDAARFLNEQADRGTIGAGRVADIVVLGANPLVNVGNVRKVEGVVHGGRYHDRRSLDARLSDLRRERSKK